MPHGKGVFYAGVQGGGLGINDVSLNPFPPTPHPKIGGCGV